MLAISLGCVGGDKLGSEGEVCFSDLDCRGELLCGPCANEGCPGICTALFVQPCEQAGAHFGACADVSDEAFVSRCAAAFGAEGLPSEEALAYGACVRSLTCLEIVSSLSMAVGPLGECFEDASRLNP